MSGANVECWHVWSFPAASNGATPLPNVNNMINITYLSNYHQRKNTLRFSEYLPSSLNDNKNLMGQYNAKLWGDWRRRLLNTKVLSLSKWVQLTILFWLAPTHKGTWYEQRQRILLAFPTLFFLQGILPKGDKRICHQSTSYFIIQKYIYLERESFVCHLIFSQISTKINI